MNEIFREEDLFYINLLVLRPGVVKAEEEISSLWKLNKNKTKKWKIFIQLLKKQEKPGK